MDAFAVKETGTPETANQAKDAKNDAVSALIALGYSASEALKALDGIEIKENTDVEDILKAALKNMAFF